MVDSFYTWTELEFHSDRSQKVKKRKPGLLLLSAHGFSFLVHTVLKSLSRGPPDVRTPYREDLFPCLAPTFRRVLGILDRVEPIRLPFLGLNDELRQSDFG